MPKVPGNIDPAQLEAITGGAWQPDPAHLMMTMADMHDRGRLIVPQDQSSTRTGKITPALPKRRGRRG